MNINIFVSLVWEFWNIIIQAITHNPFPFDGGKQQRMVATVKQILIGTILNNMGWDTITRFLFPFPTARIAAGTAAATAAVMVSSSPLLQILPAPT